MTSHQKTLLALARNPRGVRFISMGLLDRPLADLLVDLRSTRCTFLEVHAAGGGVRGLAPQDLPDVREAWLADGPAFLIGFTADQHATLKAQDPRPNLFKGLEADAALTGNPGHCARFLTPSGLRSCLRTLPVQPLHPDDYAHRLDEIDAALADAPDPDTARRIRRFRDFAAIYHRSPASTLPEGTLWTTDRAFLREDATLMPREVLPCPVFQAPPVIPAAFHSLAEDENAPLPHPQAVQSTSDQAAAAPDFAPGGQISLGF